MAIFLTGKPRSEEREGFHLELFALPSNRTFYETINSAFCSLCHRTCTVPCAEKTSSCLQRHGFFSCDSATCYHILAFLSGKQLGQVLRNAVVAVLEEARCQ